MKNTQFKQSINQMNKIEKEVNMNSHNYKSYKNSEHEFTQLS